MGHDHPFKVVIVGASVAGLSLANMLQANDIDYVVLEAHPTIAPQVGASTGLLPDGHRILDQLGLFDRIMELAPPVRSFSFRDETGSVLATYPEMDQRMIERHGYPIVFLDRQMLLQVLYDNIKDKSKILTNKRVVKVELDEDGVRAVTTDNSVFQGDIIIGADGIHSTIHDEMWRLAEGKLPSEREAPPCDYSCIFGISNPCLGILPGDLYCVFRNKSSYLVTGGPGGRVYWFRFQKLPKRLYGSAIPRYAEADLAQAIKNSADDRILPDLRFSTLIKNKVSAILTPLPEYVYKKWHHDRIFLLGDSAHKFHPIGGHGGNAAIETAAALTNDLVEALSRSSPKHLDASQLASIFAAVQKRRGPRLKAIERYSHNRQLTESLDSPLQKLIALHLLPLVGESYVTLGFSAQFPRSEKLNGMDLAHRQKLVPYKDELLAEPKSRGRMQRALIIFYLALSVTVYYGMWIRSASWGLHQKVAETVANGDFPDGPPYPLKRTYVGVQIIDDFLVLLAAMFVPGLRSWNKSLGAVQMYLLGHLVQPIAILTIEGYRGRNSLTVLALYLTSVERRLARLEHLFSQLLPDVNIDDALASRAVEAPADISKPAAYPSAPARATAPSGPNQGGSISEVVPEDADGFDWQEDMDELADGMASLYVEPKGAGYLGSTAGAFSLRSLLSWTGHSKSLLDDRAQVERPYTEIEASSQLSNQVASRQVIERLVDGYFSVYHRSYPFVHEPTFRAQFHEVMQRPQRRSWRMLLHTILALGAWCINDTRSELDDDLFHRAVSFGEDECLFESANLTFVQALILLSNLSQKRNKPNTGSNFLGLATRMALSLGLHRELPGWNIGLLQREMRRRVWWGLYMFDSGASTTFGRPILLPDTEAMDVRPVLNIHDEYLTSKTELPPTEIDQPTLYSGMKYQSDLHVRSNHISNSLLSSSGISPKDALSMDATLDRWSETLPTYLRLGHDGSIAEPSFLFNRSRLWWRFWNLKIILFRQLLLKRVVDKGNGTAPARVNQLDDKCRSIAVHAASATVASIDHYTKHGEMTRLATWYSIYFMFHACLVTSLAILGDPESPDLPRWQEELNTARHIFRNVFVSDQLATRCADILDVVVPNCPTTDDWATFQLDPALMDFSTWPTDSADDFFSVFGWSEFGSIPQ
ncbi:hypothetical protein ACJ41O_009118 [Fusarium nematophilum]